MTHGKDDREDQPDHADPGAAHEDSEDDQKQERSVDQDSRRLFILA